MDTSSEFHNPFIQIYQIVYSDETKQLKDPNFLELDNRDNLRPDWYEYWPIRNFFKNQPPKEDIFYGFLSPKFKEKTGLNASKVISFVQQNMQDFDVIIFSPQPDMGAFFLNVFEQADTFDPGFLALSEKVLALMDDPISLKNIVMDSRQIVFSNYFVAKGSFWKEWLEIADLIFNLAENKDNTLGMSLRNGTSYSNNAQVKIFLLERIASYILIKNRLWKSIRYNPFEMAWSNSRLNKYPNYAILSDALKLAYLETGDSLYISSFHKIRNDFITESHVQIDHEPSEQLLSETLQEKLTKPDDHNFTSLDSLVAKAEDLIAHNDPKSAIKIYNNYLSFKTNSMLHAAHYNIAVLYSSINLLEKAQYHLEQSLEFKSDFIISYLTLGLIQERQGFQADAIVTWQKSISFLNENNSDIEIVISILNNIGRLSEILHQYNVAEEALTQSLAIKSDQKSVIHHLIHLRQKQCKWPIQEGILERINLSQYASPLSILSLSDNPQEQRDCAERIVRETVNSFERIVPSHLRYRHDRIRIGYLSSDLSMHAVSLLTAELFEKHNRDKFEIHAFCWSKEDGTIFRERVKNAFDHFHKIGHISDEDAALLIANYEIDILIDLHGLSANMRPNILARGPAPVQITWLGYPGTTAIPNIDYVIADPYIFPRNLEKFFTEKPLYLPRIFQVSDTKRISSEKKSRVSYGLPEKSFVFCAFNNNYKITPVMFDCWMDILNHSSHSVLWLLEDNLWAKDNLLKRASDRGISHDRIFFAGRIDPRDYLARFTAADLFLDTHPYNAGTTANDALWSSLPILTLEGSTYVSRMAGSLLNSLNLNYFIAKDLEEYKEKAIALSLNTQKVKDISNYLLDLKKNGILFSTDVFVTEYENALIDILNSDRTFE